MEEAKTNRTQYKEYTELEVWKQSRILSSWIYDITRSFPKNERFGLIDQMRRSVISIPSNIAEGCGRQHTKDSIQFFYVARGSLYELETQLYLAFDQKFIDEPTLKKGLEQVIKCKKLISGFINYYKK